jgi:glycine cleavage system aminomethyltransferase T
LTSPAESPKFGNIGLGILRRDLASEGTAVEVAVEGGAVAGTIDALAIYDPRKERPRG